VPIFSKVCGKLIREEVEVDCEFRRATTVVEMDIWTKSVGGAEGQGPSKK
jgi:hypothetical protein